VGGFCVKAEKVMAFFAYRQKKSRLPLKISRRNGKVEATGRGSTGTGGVTL
jgi:hypothetical protein